MPEDIVKGIREMAEKEKPEEKTEEKPTEEEHVWGMCFVSLLSRSSR